MEKLWSNPPINAKSQSCFFLFGKNWKSQNSAKKVSLGFFRPLCVPLVTHTQTHAHSRRATKGAIKWTRCTVLEMRALLFQISRDLGSSQAAWKRGKKREWGGLGKEDGAFANTGHEHCLNAHTHSSHIINTLVEGTHSRHTHTHALFLPVPSLWPHFCISLPTNASFLLFPAHLSVEEYNFEFVYIPLVQTHTHRHSH